MKILDENRNGDVPLEDVAGKRRPRLVAVVPLEGIPTVHLDADSYEDEKVASLVGELAHPRAAEPADAAVPGRRPRRPGR